MCNVVGCVPCIFHRYIICSFVILNNAEVSFGRQRGSFSFLWCSLRRLKMVMDGLSLCLADLRDLQRLQLGQQQRLHLAFTPISFLPKEIRWSVEMMCGYIC